MNKEHKVRVLAETIENIDLRNSPRTQYTYESNFLWSKKARPIQNETINSQSYNKDAAP